MRSFVRKAVLTAVAAVAASTMLGTGVAQADPGFVPDADDLVGVGSDTTEILLNDYANAFNTRVSPTRRLASFDATGSATINPRDPGCPDVARPNGSSAGITALQTNGCFTFARSSRGPRAGEEALVFIPFAKDTIRLAFNADNDGAGGEPNYVGIRNLTPAELARIYRCSATGGDLRFSDIRSGASSATIDAVIPQTGSGSRTEFLAAIGLTEANVGPCVRTAQENDPAAVNGTSTAIVPFSRARYSVLPATGSVSRGGIILNDVTGGSLNQSRILYNVVRTNGAADVLAGLFGPSNGAAPGGGFLCENPGFITKNGFQVLGAGDPVCGSRI